MKTQVKYYQVAGITIQVKSDFPITENTFHPKFKSFEVAGPGEDNVVINHHFYLPDFSKETQLFKREVYNKDQWQIFKSEKSWIFKYTSILSSDIVNFVIGVMSNDFRTINIYTENLTKEKYGMGAFSALTLFNTDQMIFAKLLCDRKGVMIHSNGFNINGNGILLAGISGSGKSTLSRMLKKQSHEILCDDRMFIRNVNDEFQIFGNWCYGSHPDVSSSSAPLNGFLFLEKGTQNTIVEIKEKKMIASRLLQVIVRPLLDVDGWQKYFKTIDDLREKTKFFQIEFDLSGDICRVINNFFRH
jgi:hypothetical protein